MACNAAERTLDLGQVQGPAPREPGFPVNIHASQGSTNEALARESADDDVPYTQLRPIDMTHSRGKRKVTVNEGEVSAKRTRGAHSQPFKKLGWLKKLKLTHKKRAKM